MEAKNNRRKSQRQALDPPELGYLLEALGQFVLKACARKTAQRYQTVDEVIEVLLPLAEEMGLPPNLPTQNKKSLTTLHLIYQDEQRLALKQLLEDFSAKARKLGVELKAAEFPEI